jgi:hypothetical protein
MTEEERKRVVKSLREPPVKEDPKAWMNIYPRIGKTWRPRKTFEHEMMNRWWVTH